MTRQRHYEKDTPFGAWLRSQKDLPSNDADFGFIATDVDMTVQNWRTKETGERIQKLMHIEVKTRSGGPKYGQWNSLTTLGSFAGEKVIQSILYKFYGVFFLTLSNTSPDNSEKMWWCGWKYNKEGNECKLTKHNLIWHEIDEKMLIRILRFEVDPATLEEL